MHVSCSVTHKNLARVSGESDTPDLHASRAGQSGGLERKHRRRVGLEGSSMIGGSDAGTGIVVQPSLAQCVLTSRVLQGQRSSHAHTVTSNIPNPDRTRPVCIAHVPEQPIPAREPN